MEGVEPFVIVLILALGILAAGAIFTSFEEGLSVDRQPRTQSTQLFLASPGEIGQTRTDTRVADLGAFSVGMTRDQIEAVRLNNLTVSDKIFTGTSRTFTYEAENPQEGAIRFNVKGKKGIGKLQIAVNGKILYSEDLVSDSSPKIRIPEKALGTGLNTFKVKANSRGILDSTKYRLTDFEIDVNDRKFHQETQNFNIYGFELRNLVKAQLSYSVEEATPTNPLKIRVNGNELYSFVQIPSTNTVEITPSNSQLTAGSNRIEFSTSRPSKYHIENAQISITYIGTSERPVYTLDFSATQSQQRFAEREETTESVSFNYLPLTGQTNPLKITVNNQTETISPVVGHNTVEIPEIEYRDGNTFEMSSEAAFKTTNIRFRSELSDR